MKCESLPVALIVNNVIITQYGECVFINPSTGVNTAKELLKLLTKINYTVFKFDELHHIELTINQRDRVNKVLMELPEELSCL